MTPVTVTLRIGGQALVAELDDAAVAAIAAALGTPQGEAASPWLYGDKAAAAYLGWPLGRVQKLSAAGILTCHQIGQRKAYRRDRLDQALLGTT